MQVGLLTSVFNFGKGWTVSFALLLSISLFSLVLVGCLFFQIISDYLIPCFHARPFGNLPLTLTVVHPLDQALSSILATWPNHCGPLSLKHFLKLFSFNLVVLLSAEILPPDWTIIHPVNHSCIIPLIWSHLHL